MRAESHGFDLEIGGPATRLPRCPVAYTRGDEIAYAVGNKVLVGDRVVFTADGGITYAKFGSDGSLAVVIDGERLERWDGSSLTTTKIPPELPGHHANPSCTTTVPRSCPSARPSSSSTSAASRD